jgi:hypothetical protein
MRSLVVDVGKSQRPTGALTHLEHRRLVSAGTYDVKLA